MSSSWDDAVAFALTLPTSPQVRGKQIVSRGRTSGDFVLRATREEIGVLIERTWWDHASTTQRSERSGGRP